jgi:hypothetical protein
LKGSLCEKKNGIAFDNDYAEGYKFFEAWTNRNATILISDCVTYFVGVHRAIRLHVGFGNHCRQTTKKKTSV